MSFEIRIQSYNSLHAGQLDPLVARNKGVSIAKIVIVKERIPKTIL